LSSPSTQINIVLIHKIMEISLTQKEKAPTNQ